MKNTKKISHYITILPLFIITLMFIILPLLGMFKDSFFSMDNILTLQNYKEILAKAIYHMAVKNSMYITVISTVLGLILSFIIALSITLIGGKGKSIFLSILNMVSNFAGLPLAFAFIVILGNSGVFILMFKSIGINFLAKYNLYSKEGLLLLYIYFQIPLGTLVLIPAFQSIRDEWKESAALMNASPFQFWTKIGIPVLFPSLMDTFSLLFANALTAYATVVLLVSTNIPLLPVKITTMFTGEMTMQKQLGSALSIVMLGIMLVVIAICNLAKNKLFTGGRKI